MIKSRKGKVGRNEPCPCGSGLKYKKCHGRVQSGQVAPTPSQIKNILEEHKAKEVLRQHQQGRGRPIISTEFQGYRFTAVGNKIHYSKAHKTFIDFLGHYIKAVLGADWGNAEIAKPLEERHVILQWYHAVCSLQLETIGDRPGTVQSVQENGLLSAYYGLAYNLYLLQHNVELQDYLIRRLKRNDSFYSAYYETFVAAWFILSGFSLRLEDEQDSSRTHPEFIASRDGQSYSVEAKARQPCKEHLDVGNQLYKALRIEAYHPRVVFIDMNVGPDIDPDEFAKQASAVVQGRERKMLIKGEPAPPAHVYITNQPYHLALERTSIPRICFVTGFKIDYFGYGARFESYTSAYKAKKKHEALYDVQKAMASYSIPTTFDGEISEFTFGQAERRLCIGARFEIGDGRFGTLQSGVVVESEKRAYLVVNTDDGSAHILSKELTDHEIAAYKAHPETFFGRVQKVKKSSNDPLELYEIFIESYRDTPRDRLLELMSSAPNIDQLRAMPDDELLYYYAEGLTHVAMKKKGQ